MLPLSYLRILPIRCTLGVRFRELLRDGKGAAGGLARGLEMIIAARICHPQSIYAIANARFILGIRYGSCTTAVAMPINNAPFA